MSTQYVRIHYGPCRTFSQPLLTAQHKPQLLTGLRQRLRELGYRVDINPVEYINYCLVEMCGYAVFQCNLQHLKFNTQCRRDQICQRAVDAVLQATKQFSRARNILWAWSLINDSMFKRSEFAATDHWLEDEPIEPFQLKCPDSCTCRNDEQLVSRESTWSYECGPEEQEGQELSDL